VTAWCISTGCFIAWNMPGRIADNPAFVGAAAGCDLLIFAL
jgi:hypothetical protein